MNSDLLSFIDPLGGGSMGKRVRPPIDGRDISVPALPDGVDMFLNQSTVLAGESKTGKSFMIDWIMEKLSTEIPNVIIYCSTEGSTETETSYGERVHPAMIFDHFKREHLHMIDNRQQMASRAYAIANDTAILSGIYAKVHAAVSNNARTLSAEDHAYLRNSLMLVARFTESYHSSGAAIRAKIGPSPESKGNLKNALKKLKRDFNAQINRVYKLVIRRFEQFLGGDHCELSVDEKVAVRFLYLNPKLLVVYDDVIQDLVTAMKDAECKRIILSQLFAGRHQHLTTLWATQDETMLIPPIRKNANNVIITSKSIAMTYFDKKSMGFSKVVCDTARKVTAAIFDNSDPDFCFAKMCYRRMEQKPFFYVIATTPDDYSFGCVGTRTLCKTLAVPQTLDKTNPFYRSFAL
jgi:hypothetical protein